MPGPRARQPGAWTDRRVLIFTEYEDTQRYLEQQLREAIADTDRADERIAIFHGPTPPDRREEIKRAFNADPTEHPLRILIATDAAREGLNLQTHCRDLFHFDVPWNPSRLEQRNGRIDRKLQPAPEVYCHYFVYTQRPEDRVLQALVEKTETIRAELGSLAQVLETRVDRAARAAASAARDVEQLEADDRARRSEDERAAHEPRRSWSRSASADAKLARQIERLRDPPEDVAATGSALDRDQLQRVVSCALELLARRPLRPVGDGGGTGRFAFPTLDQRRGARPTGRHARHAARRRARRPEASGEWRAAHLRPVVFEPPEDDRRRRRSTCTSSTASSSGCSAASPPRASSTTTCRRACLAQSADADPARRPARPPLPLRATAPPGCTRRSCASPPAGSSPRSARRRLRPTPARPSARR